MLELKNINLGGLGELQNANFHNLAVAPTTNLRGGRFYYSTVDNTLYVYNGSQWLNALAQGTTYSAGSGIDITGGAISIDNSVTGATKCKITYNSQGLVTAGADLQASDIPSLTLSKISDVTVSAADVNSVTSKIGLTSLSIASGSSNYLSYDNSTGQFSANVDTTVGTVSTNLVTSGAVKTYVDNAVTGVIIPKGSISAISGLPTLTASHLGWMYNFSASFTTTSDFVEGSGQTYPAGTNVVVVEYTSGTYKYDVFSGFVDTSSFITASSTNTLTNKTIDADDNTISDLTTSNFKSGTIVTSVGATGADTALPTEKAVRSAITTATSGMAKVYTITNPALTVSGGVCTWTVTHSLGSSVGVHVYEVSSGDEVGVDVTLTSSSVATVKLLAASNVSAGTYKVVVIGG